MPGQCRRRLLVVLFGACVLAGCQPYATGTIPVDPHDPAVRSFKGFEDVKRPNAAKDRRQAKAPGRL